MEVYISGVAIAFLLSFTTYMIQGIKRSQENNEETMAKVIFGGLFGAVLASILSWLTVIILILMLASGKVWGINEKQKKRTLYDEFQDSTVELFRSIHGADNLSLIENISDEVIFKISQEVIVAFKKAAEEKGERIAGGHLLTIAMYFLSAYAEFGEDWCSDHLKYEIDKYLTEGLREDYKQNLF